MFRSGFFTSDSWTINGDGFAIGNKAEGSDFLAKIVSVAVTDGVPYLPTSNLQVTATTGMILSVGAGFGFKDGYMAWETADTTITCTSSASDQTLYISARLDTTTGEFTGSKVDKYTTFVAATDICFAIVVIPANAVTITSAMITDVRGNATYCGYITDQREYLETLTAWLQNEIANVIAGGMPDHASTHAAAGDDPITPASIGAQDAMTAGIDYADPTTISIIISDGFFTGGGVAAQGTPNQTVAVASGSVVTPEGNRYPFDAVASLAASAADATNPRIDIVYVSSTGVVTYLAGTAAATPAQPSTPANGTVLAAVRRAANDNTISTTDITLASSGKYGIPALASGGKVANSYDTYSFSYHGTSYTLASGDEQHIVHASSDVTINYTIPPNVFPAGTIIPFYVLTGKVTFVAGSGVTLEPIGGYSSVAGRNMACIIQRATNYWIIVGGTE